MRKLIFTVFCCALLAFGLAPPAHASSLDFNISAHSPSIGSISYAGGANPLVGAGILVDTVTGLGTPLHAGAVLTLSNAFLNFTSGNLVSSDASHWFFGGGGNIQIVGNVPALGLVGATLLAGSFNSAMVDYFGGTFKVSIVSFIDEKDPTLVDFYYGAFAPPGFRGHFNLAFNSVTALPPPAAFDTAQMLSGDVVNDPVPEPASLLLLGTGLAALGRWRRRK